MPEARWRVKAQRNLVTRDSEIPLVELRKTIAPLFGHCVALLAMKHRRAPLPVPSALWKGLLQRGVPNNLEELESLAERYLFMGDVRMLLTELTVQPPSPAEAMDVVERGESESSA